MTDKQLFGFASAVALVVCASVGYAIGYYQNDTDWIVVKNRDPIYNKISASAIATAPENDGSIVLFCETGEPIVALVHVDDFGETIANATSPTSLMEEVEVVYRIDDRAVNKVNMPIPSGLSDVLFNDIFAKSLDKKIAIRIRDETVVIDTRGAQRAVADLEEACSEGYSK